MENRSTKRGNKSEDGVQASRINDSAVCAKVLKLTNRNSMDSPRKDKLNVRYKTRQDLIVPTETKCTPSRTKPKISDSFGEAGKICVYVRIRPMNQKELFLNADPPFEISDNEITVKNGLTCDMTGGVTTKYVYDDVFWASRNESQLHVFNKVALPLLDSALEGYNACLFAYGQTGSGKTFSMMGGQMTEHSVDSGIIPRFCEELLIRTNNQVTRYEIKLSYYEIYNEKIYDLLVGVGQGESKTSLRVREHPTTGPYVENLSLHSVDSLKTLNFLLRLGNGRRVTCATLHNERSSRSHTILEIMMSFYKDGCNVQSKVSLVDLAGSERVAHSQVSGDRFKEGLSINKSLLTLGKVIASLSDLKKCSFVPYRESVLTWLLKESLGGNSRTAMLATVSPSADALEESLATLRYACQARHIINRVSINEDPQHKVIRDLQKEVERLKLMREDFARNRASTHIENSENIKSLNLNHERYQKELHNLESKQKAVEDKLHLELSRLEQHLKDTEKRRDELESQKMLFLEELKTDSVSMYESNFLETLESIFNHSGEGNSSHLTEASPVTREDLQHLENIKKSVDALHKNISLKVKSNYLPLHKALPLLNDMKFTYDKINQIFSLSTL